MSQTVVMKLLKDGSGRVCVHWFERMPLTRACTCQKPVNAILGCTCGANDGSATAAEKQAYPAVLPAPTGKIEVRGTAKITGPGYDDSIVLNGVRGRIACNRTQNSVTPHQRGADLLICCHSDDVRAVTCPACMETPEFLAAAEEVEGFLAISQE